MEPLSPLAAFQALCLTLAAAILIDSRKDVTIWRYVLWAIASVIALFGVFAGAVGDAWPAALTAMERLGGSPPVWFVAAVGFYFIVRPFWKSAQAVTYDDSALVGRVSELENTKRAIIDDYQRMSGLEVKMESEVDGLKLAFQDVSEQVQTNLRIYEEKLATYAGEQQIKWLGIEALRDAQAWAMRALYEREQLLSLAREISSSATALKSHFDGNNSIRDSDWDTWKQEMVSWEGSVLEWCRYAAPYLNGEPMELVRKLEAADFEGDWTVNAAQFPDAEGIRVYKTFSIYLRNWRRLATVVHDNVKRQAFDGLQTRARDRA